MYNNSPGIYTEKEIAEAWSEVGDTVKTYSDELIKRWKEEIDNYLTFVRSWLTLM